MAALHHRTSVRVRVADVLGPEFRTKLVLRQGCVMAPVLLNLYLDAVLRKTPCLPGVSVEVVPRSQFFVPNSFRSKKTKVMVIGTDFSSLEPCVVSSSKLDYVDCFTYLGSDVFSDCDVHKEITRRLGKAFQSFSSLMTPLWKRREVSVQTKSVSVTLLLSVLCYMAQRLGL